jgi:hypothetical protein
MTPNVTCAGTAKPQHNRRNLLRFACAADRNVFRNLAVRPLAPADDAAGDLRINQLENDETVCTFFFLPTSSSTISLRSVCGEDRRSPELRAHLRPTAAPHVGQATESNFWGVRPLIFIRKYSDDSPPKNCTVLSTLGG